MESQSHKPRRLTSTVLSLMLVLSVLAVMNFASMNVRASGIEYVDWNDYNKYIFVDDTFPHTGLGYDSAVINLTNGNLIICDGVTLTFNDDVTFKMINTNASAGDYGIIVNSTASFIVDSPSGTTEIKSGSTPVSRTYKFTNSGTIDFL